MDYVNEGATGQGVGKYHIASIWKAIPAPGKMESSSESPQKGYKLVSGDILLPDVIIKYTIDRFLKRTM